MCCSLYTTLLYTPLPHPPRYTRLPAPVYPYVSTAARSSTEIKATHWAQALGLSLRGESKWHGVAKTVNFDRQLVRLSYYLSSGHIPLDWITSDETREGTCASRGETDSFIKHSPFATSPLLTPLFATRIPTPATPGEQRQNSGNTAANRGKWS